ncbi:MAG: hypothetical protein A3G81_20935 [Betaproteobacteria bacterium RIFCSPLOWO2_12_FULL_65_14]|nr:MAG: hypothetical protein A3G81_20935 [Betaproteobacteria bacterium RIFCSPLOWO2_12_FULL_65_14]
MRPVEYDVMATVETHHWWYKALRQFLMRSVTKIGFEPRGKTVIDAGCGTGGCYQAFVERFPDVTYVAMDLEARALDYCRTRGSRTLVRATVHHIPVRRESADLVICFDVLPCTSVSPRLAVREFHGALRFGGFLILNVPAFNILRGQHDAAVGIQRRFRRRQACSILTEAGFTVVTATYWNMVLFPPMALWRWLSRSEEMQPVSDLRRFSWAQWMCTVLISMELLVTQRIRLPLGSSLFIVAQKLAGTAIPPQMAA